MKNNNEQNQIVQSARATRVERATTDVLVNPHVVARNASKIDARPRRKRKIDYAKKIMNDSFIMNI